MVTHKRRPSLPDAFRDSSARSIDRRLLLLGLAGAGGALVAGCGGGDYGSRMPRPMASGCDRVRQAGPAGFPEVAFADWTEMEPEYVLYPGDEIEIATPTATELTRTQKVGPDGRISLPLAGQILAADRTIAEVEADASAAFVPHLRRPIVEVTLKTAGPIRVWVDGEVRTPGVYDMTGDIEIGRAHV